jgi:hypothetical protein
MILVTGPLPCEGAVAPRLASLGYDAVAMVRDVQAANTGLRRPKRLDRPGGVCPLEVRFQERASLERMKTGWRLSVVFMLVFQAALRIEARARSTPLPETGRKTGG